MAIVSPRGKKRDSDGVIYGIISPQNGARTSDGYEPELENDFATQTNHTAYVYNWGYGGERTDQGVNRIDSVLDSREADFILIMEGANDLGAGVSASTTKANLRIMIEKSQGKDTEPIIATVTPNTARSDGYIIPNNYNPAIRSLALEKDIALADQYTALVGNWSGYNSGDGLHLNDVGERVMAQEWFDAILNGTGTGGTCDVFQPGADWCRDCGPCAEGEGDCDNDNECQTGLVCAQNVGANYGWPATRDVCEQPGGGPCSVFAPGPDWCRDCGPCAEGEGDCDSDNECQNGLVCAQDVGANYGWPATRDVCELPSGPGDCILDSKFRLGSIRVGGIALH